MVCRLRSDCKVCVLVLSLAFLSGCDAFDTHPFDTRVEGKTDINASNIQTIERLCRDKDTLTFAFVGDTQGWYDETEAMVSDINRRQVDFVVHGGDFTNHGTTDEFERQRDILSRLDVPWVGLIGNHDCFGTGVTVFQTMFGALNFTFVAARVRFICLNTNGQSYCGSEDAPDFRFIEAQLSGDSTRYDRTVFCMHAPPLCEQFDGETATTFDQYVRRFPNVLFCITAHLHGFKARDLFGHGLIYYTCDSARHRNYLVFTITQDGYSYEVVRY